MATLVKRKTGWQAQICVRGKRRAKTFKLRSDAMRWAREMELEPLVEFDAQRSRMPFVELLRLYLAEHSASVKFSYVDQHPLGSMRICDIEQRHIEEFLRFRATVPAKRTGRVLKLSSLDNLRHTFSSALKFAVSRHWIKSNPVTSDTAFKLPHQFRERVPSLEEYDLLKKAAYWDGESCPITLTQKACAAFRFSMLTGMRAGEICAIEASWLDGRVLRIPAQATKTKQSRNVALSLEAMKLLDTMLSAELTPVWGITNTQRNAAFCRIRDMAGLGEQRDSAGRTIKQALHFHDARAFFCTWAASRGKDGQPRLTPLELARQLGHQSLEMTMRYYRISPEEIAEKLG